MPWRDIIARLNERGELRAMLEKSASALTIAALELNPPEGEDATAWEAIIAARNTARGLLARIQP